MHTILGTALFSLIISLLLTPLVKRAALKFHLVDMPSARKVHTRPIPRIGGIAIFFGVALAFVPSFYIDNRAFERIFLEPRIIYVFVGGLVIFLLGVVDDLKGLNARVKFTVQLLVAGLIYYGGVRIGFLDSGGLLGITLGWLSLPVTLFWMVLVMNAINLIDGLDGLAAGVGFFISGVLMVLCLIQSNFLPALVLASLCGAVLGFLWYNFNPATIFMGDSGSYFIGYLIGALSILGSFKSQAAATILIPVIALGIPLMDTVFAALRRFMEGRGMFSADRDHFHHRLIALGLSQRKAVLVLYSGTILLGMMALSTVYLDDAKISMLILMLFVGSVAGIRKLGYGSHISSEALSRWGTGVANEVGLTRKRRVLNAFQAAIFRAGDIAELWDILVKTMDSFYVDYVWVQLWDGKPVPGMIFEKYWHKNDSTKDLDVLYQYNRLYMRFPFEKNGIYFGHIALSKEAFDSSHSRYLTLSQIEHIRRSMADKLSAFHRDGVLDVGKKRVC